MEPKSFFLGGGREVGEIGRILRVKKRDSRFISSIFGP